MPKYTKTGGFGKLLKDPAFWAPTVALGMGAAAAAGMGHLEKVREAKAQSTAFKEMLDIHPQLKSGRDPKLVKRIYTSLHNVNPMMARDPMVAGAWVDTIMESGGLDQGQSGRALLEGVKELAQIRSHLSQAQRGESSVGRAIGAGVTRQVEHGFMRYDALEKEHGELGTKEKRIKGLEDSLKQRIHDDTGKLTGRYEQAVARNPTQAKEIMHALIGYYKPKQASKSASKATAGQRLIAACGG